MKFIVIDWMYNVCFESQDVELPSFEDGWQFLEDKLSTIYGEDYEELDIQDYYVEEYREGIDRLMWNGQRYVFKPDYYKATA